MRWSEFAARGSNGAHVGGVLTVHSLAGGMELGGPRDHSDRGRDCGAEEAGW